LRGRYLQASFSSPRRNATALLGRGANKAFPGGLFGSQNLTVETCFSAEQSDVSTMQNSANDGLRLAFFSDLHLECGAFESSALEADIVVLAGDIAPKLNGLRFAEQLAQRCEVLYILGNHEFYGTHTNLANKLKSLASSRVHILDNDDFVFRDVRFLGCTLWTDFELIEHKELAYVTALGGMNDYRRIRNADAGYKRLRPGHTITKHLHSRTWLEGKLREPFDGKTVVITHHAPSIRSLHERDFAEPISSAYASHLDALVQESRAALWLHGHTHRNVDYQIGETRILTNQRGYPDEPMKGFDPSGKVIDL
jgi:predicted phosphodiesterase